MRTKYKFGLVLVCILALGAGITWWLLQANIAVLQPKGIIAEQQRNLLVFATILSLLVVLPVYAMTFYIARTYRESNQKAEYKPDWDHSNKLEAIWWGLPILLISILAVIAWNSSHSLDPSKPLSSTKKPVRVQVIALEWKWLFIYPEQGIASINTLHIPANTPINFEITADAPMNSLWIPELGGQIYAMAGMNTKLHLMANQTGNFNGSSANLSGEGFSGMKFITHAVSPGDFTDWAASIASASPEYLSQEAYQGLTVPTKNILPSYYGRIDRSVYAKVIKKYMPLQDPAESDMMLQNHLLKAVN